jgi:hypothetical protein
LPKEIASTTLLSYPNTTTKMPAEKRKQDATSAPDGGDRKKAKKGFQVGPANLPDGTYKRKAKKIKDSLIERALIQKEYARLKRQGKIPDAQEDSIPVPASAHLDQATAPTPTPTNGDAEDKPAAPLREASPPSAPHPDRQNLMTRPSLSPEPARVLRAPREPAFLQRARTSDCPERGSGSQATGYRGRTPRAEAQD